MEHKAKFLASAILGGLLACGAAAEGDSILLWYADTSAATEGGQNKSFDSVKFWAVDENAGDTMIDLSGRTYTSPTAYTGPESLRVDNAASLGSVAAQGAMRAGSYYTDVSGLDGYSLMMELWYGGTRVDWMKSAVALGDFLSGGTRSGSVFSLSALTDDFNPVETAGYNFAEDMVPEPTSAVLLLLGVSALSLRRKRRV